ncbi:hypothetical protein CMQ_5641 [Grosmannia clavigera kw1407]|uniref:Uncharacterized protein n=1 Tax=Grosmannia clavigera (strain kw1407 / UAMH 11150) TaxID=655863 RepID=F0XSU2_GROCL|nr:uncharacterized protein CMQ_5641 [Grosmannia clavigera kw1407]EFW99220.1 hypothetical protein CMQ_5641 [Grosmannia clavigera kw1407]
MSEPFEDNEKRSMLAELIRASRIDVGAVVEFVKRYNIQPNWMDMRYPNGALQLRSYQQATVSGHPKVNPRLLVFLWQLS